MTAHTSMPSEQSSFKTFLFQDKRNRGILWLAAAAIIIQFAVFKYLYPFASFIHGDSFEYLNAAYDNLTINTYMIGYSKFLRLVSVFAKPDIVLVAIQYLLIQFGALYLLFTIFYFYRPGKSLQVMLLCFMILNPLFLHLANLVSSDGLFLAISMVWFALLLWLIFRPTNGTIVWHAIVLFLAFTVRYNALIYPFIAVAAFGLSKLSLRLKIIGIALPVMLCGWFVVLTMYQYKKLTGYWQYSPFSGWQLANNAMYAYRYIDSAAREPVLEKYKNLDSMVRHFYDRTRNLTMWPSEKEQASTFYMWSRGMPLMRYRDSLFKMEEIRKETELRRWASMGPLYKDYGMYIISKYPVHFLKYFAWPNAIKYYAPPIEFLGTYNSDKDDVTERAKTWFGYNTREVKTRMSDSKTWILDFYPVLSGIINVLMLFGVVYYALLKGWQYNKKFNRIVLLAGIVWLMNAMFTILASSVALRFQSFPVLLSAVFASLLIDWMVQLMKSIKYSDNQKVDHQVTEKAIVI